MLHPRLQPARRFALLLLALCSSAVLAQEVQIRSRVELVVVPVTVKGKNNTLATGLTRESFTIKEAGKTQTITDFSVDPVPISAAILFDTGISEAALARVKASFPALLGAFADEDEVAVYRFDKSIEKVGDFTPDRVRLTAMLQKLQSATPSASDAITAGPFSMPPPVLNGMPVTPGVNQSVGLTTARPTKVLHDTMFQAAEDLATRSAGRRRILLIISDGQNHNSQFSYDAALERLLMREVQVFAIGLDTTVFQRMRSPLASYAKDTGGEAWFPDSQSGIESCNSLSTEGARNQYLLTYVSSNKRPVGKPVFREIKVQVAIKDGEIRHKRGYYQAP
jgi:VWFA-related protein